MGDIFIPTNYDRSSGFLGGKLKTRNSIEAGVIGFIMYQFLKSILGDMGIFNKMLIYTIFIGLPVGIALVGIKGDSLTQYLGSLFKFIRKRRKLRFRRVDKYESIR